MEFTGFPVAALDFYDDLEVDNTKSFWEAHQATYDRDVKAPMVALGAALAPEFGEAKIFRPYRDVRFSKDKTPYKTHQGCYVPTGPATGYYVQVSARGVMVGAGFYHADSRPLAAYREAVADATTGPRLARLLARLVKSGWDIGGDTLKTAPRGYAADHARIGLLRHKSLTLSKSYGFAPVIHEQALIDQVRSDWRTVRPLLDWVGGQVHARAAD